MGQFLYILSNYGFVMIFGILAIATAFIHSPRVEGMESYRKSRRILGAAYALMALYCILRLHLIHDYWSYCVLVIVTYSFAWMTYFSILTLMEIPHYQQRSFYIDVLIPIMIIIAVSVTGSFFPKLLTEVHVAIACLYVIKICRMFYVTGSEYFKCKGELENYFEDSREYRWIGFIIIFTFPMLIGSILAFFIANKYHVFFAIVPIFYIYYTIKLINFASTKVNMIRRKNLKAAKADVEAVKEKISGIEEKVGPLAEQWVREKRYCREDLSIKDVAKEMGTNHNYLSQYLNNILNMSFQVWLNTLRIEESKILLTEEEGMSIEEIGAKVGIPQNYNFSRWFKTVTGTTPFQYRKYSQGNK